MYPAQSMESPIFRGSCFFRGGFTGAIVSGQRIKDLCPANVGAHVMLCEPRISFRVGGAAVVMPLPCTPRVGGGGRDERRPLTQTLIRPSGLCLLPLVAINPKRGKTNASELLSLLATGKQRAVLEGSENEEEEESSDRRL